MQMYGHENLQTVFRKKYLCWVAEPTVCHSAQSAEVANKWLLDLQVHGESVKHKNNICDESSSWKITSYFMQMGSKIDDTHVAEGTLGFHWVTHQ